MHWYVLFVRTCREYKVEHLLKVFLDKNLNTPFVPLHAKLFKISGIVKEEVKPLFPSYVFVESEEPSTEFIKHINKITHTTQDIFHLMKYSDNEIALRETEKQMLLSLCNDDYCIELSKGLIEGDRIHIIEGPLKGFESIVKKVNRHKRIAIIEMSFMGELREIVVGLEIIEKV